MIYVTQGHEKGIGLEVFIKSLILIDEKEYLNFTLICNPIEFEKNLSMLSIPKSFFSKLNFIFFNQNKKQSTIALEIALKEIKEDDVLITLPTSKEELILNGKTTAGHTDYFRKFFKKEVNMFFKSYESNVLLISDHIPLAEVAQTIDSNLIYLKTKLCIDEHAKYFSKFKNILITGINPHSGEGGILGNEDHQVSLAVKSLKESYPKLSIKGPIPGDSILINNQFKQDSLFVYMYHDQGLSPFKSIYKTIGANISLGLPFLRLSVDHGTAFEMYGKNTADYMGSFHILKLALSSMRKL